MQELDDIALLREYVERDSESAFATLITRHIDRVYSVALRHTRNPHQAEEITQAVFVILARKASQLRKTVVLEGWLYQTARLTAVTFIRSEIRRSRREQETQMQTETNEDESEAWSQIFPLLDAALAGLNETDRNAVVMRFFYGKTLREIGAALGGSEDKARMRVNRAVEKLRTFFTKRGVVVPTAVLMTVMAANSVQAAPPVLAQSVAALALVKGSTAGGSTLTLIKGALKLMAWTKAKTAVAVVVILTGASATTAIIRHQTKPNEAEAPAISPDTNPNQLAFAGYATPEATIKTMLWATSNGDSAAYLECLTPEMKLQRQKQWQGRSKEALVAEGKQQFAMASGMKIIDQTSVSADRVVLTLQFPANGRTEKMPFIRIGGDWKVAR